VNAHTPSRTQDALLPHFPLAGEPGATAGGRGFCGLACAGFQGLPDLEKQILRSTAQIGKLAHPAAIRQQKKRGPRQRVYTREVQAALIEVWGLFDYPCGQRLAPALRKEIARLRRAKELVCSDAVAAKLEEISPRSIDRLLDREKRLRGLRQNRNPSVHPLLYQKVPVKVASEWDTTEVGNLQLDYVFHCGRSTAGEYVHTLSAADIATGWWEGEAIMGRSQVATKAGMESIRQRLPFRIREVHPDNDSGMVNDLLWGYCKEAKPPIKMSRSRPYQKNDNCWVEQRNWTHVRKVAGYRRLDTAGELAILRELYGSVTFVQELLPADDQAGGEGPGGGQDPSQVRRTADTFPAGDGVGADLPGGAEAAASQVRIAECGGAPQTH
jgi:hypothetical protein